MGSSKEEEEAEAIISTPNLPLLSIQLAGGISRRDFESPEHSGMLTPPLHTSASVPFRWEEEPGKPRPYTALITTLSDSDHHHPNTNNITLELPPRLQLVVTTPNCDQKMTKMPSPTTVLDGPYYSNLPLFQSSSFRFTRRRRREQRQGSFGSSCGSPDQRGHFGNSIVPMSKKSLLDEGKGRRSPKGGGGGGFFGSWRRKSSSQTHKRGKSVDGSSSMEIAGLGGVDDDLESGGSGGGAKVSRIRRNGSFSGLSQVRSHFWATIYKGFKQVLPLKSTTSSKKDGLPV